MPHNSHNGIRCTLRNSIWENQARRWGLYLALFFLSMKCKYKERWTHYGIGIDTVSRMDAIGSYTSSIPLSISHSLYLLNYGTIINTIIMELLPFLGSNLNIRLFRPFPSSFSNLFSIKSSRSFKEFLENHMTTVKLA